MIDVPDHAQYWSWVTSSRAGFWISNRLTPEPNSASFFNVMMWLLAKVQVATNLGFPGLFQVWRVMGTMVVVLATLAFTHLFLDDQRERWTASWIVLLGSGLGWILVGLKYAMHVETPPWPTAVYVVEPNTFLAILGYPYIAIAQGLLALSALGVFGFYDSGRRRFAACAVVSAALLAAFHTYDLISLYALLGVFSLAVIVTRRVVPWRFVGMSAVVFVVSIPIGLYYRSLTTGDPLWREVLAQYANAGVWTPPPLGVLIIAGVPGVLALWSISNTTWKQPKTLFLWAWVASSLLLVHVPTVYQIKFFTGWQFPLAALSAMAWHRRVHPWVAEVLTRMVKASPRTRQQVGGVILVVLMLPTSAYLYLWRFLDLSRHQSPFYLQRTELSALEWLSQQSNPRDVVLAPLDVGQFVPSYGNARAFLAHWAGTARYFERRDAVDRFFARDTTDQWRQSLLDDARVTLVVATERPDAYNPSQSPLFRMVFEAGDVRVFRYLPGEAWR